MDANVDTSGNCGVDLTVGMAVDANIIIFARSREEIEMVSLLQSREGRFFWRIFNCNC